MLSSTQKGVVITWQRGAGTILSQDNEEYFLFHRNAAEPHLLQVGDVVTFTPGKQNTRYGSISALNVKQTGEQLGTIENAAGTFFKSSFVAESERAKFITGNW